MHWIDDGKDSFSWLEVCFIDQDVLVDELSKLDNSTDWIAALDSFTSADFQDDLTVVFTAPYDYFLSPRYAERLIRDALHNGFGEWVAVTVLREAKS